MLTLSQLLTPRTEAQLRAQLLQALQGVGFVLQKGTGLGSVSASGIATANASVVLEVVTAGEPGVATVKASTDGGATFGAPFTIPASPATLTPIGSTGASVSFSAGPPGSPSASFVAGDRYSFEVATPTLPVTSWQPGSVPLTLAGIDAQAMADVDTLVADIAASGLVDYATGPWLDLLASNVYGLTRLAGTRAVRYLQLTDAANAGPFTIPAGQFWATDASGHRFQALAGGTLSAGQSVTLEVTADAIGQGWVAITKLITTLPGVTFADLGQKTAGVDPETDAALRIRCKARWAALGMGAPSSSYDYWARGASASVTKTKIKTSTTVPAQVLVYVAGPTGTVGTAELAAVDAAVQANVPLGASAVVSNAAVLTVALSGTVLFKKGSNTTARQNAVRAALDAYFAALPIGGTLLQPSGLGISLEALIAVIFSAGEVLDISLSSPAADVALTDTQVAIGDYVALAFAEAP